LGITSRAALNAEGVFATNGSLKVVAGSGAYGSSKSVYQSIVKFDQGVKGFDTTGVGSNWVAESLVCMPTVADAAKFWCVLAQLINPNGGKYVYVYAWSSVSKKTFDNKSSLENQMGSPDLESGYTGNELRGNPKFLALDTDNKFEVNIASTSTITATEFSVPVKFTDVTLTESEATAFEAAYKTKLGNFWGATMIFDGTSTYTLYQEADASIIEADSATPAATPADSSAFAMGAITAALTLVAAL